MSEPGEGVGQTSWRHIPTFGGRSPHVDRMTDRRFWKHYLPLRSVKMHIELSWPNTVTFRLRLTVNKCHQRSKMALVDDEAEEEGWMGWKGVRSRGVHHGTWDTHTPYWHLVVTTKTRTVGKRTVRMLLECFLIMGFFQKSCKIP